MLKFQDLAKITVEAIHENKEEVGLIDEKGKNTLMGFIFECLFSFSALIFYRYGFETLIYKTRREKIVFPKTTSLRLFKVTFYC